MVYEIEPTPVSPMENPNDSRIESSLMNCSLSQCEVIPSDEFSLNAVLSRY